MLRLNTNNPKQIILSNDLIEKKKLLGVNKNTINLAEESINSFGVLPSTRQSNLNSAFLGLQYIHPGGLFNNNWKGFVTETSVEFNGTDRVGNISSIQVRLNAPTSSQPETNFPRDGRTFSSNTYNRASRGLPSISNSKKLNETDEQNELNEPILTVMGRYNGIYTSARGKSAGRTGPLNPIKHWRKQLIPKQGHITGKPTLNDVILNPGTTSLDSSCCDVISNKGMLNNYLPGGYIDNGTGSCIKGSWVKPDKCVNVIRNELSNFQPVYFNNPEKVTRPRSSQTILKKNYYTTGAAYLRSRVKLYEQNQLLSTVNQQPGKSNELFMNNGNALNQRLPPSNDNWVYANTELKQGSQAFNANNCVSDLSACCAYEKNMNACQVPITFKPNNPFYAVQGAVDSSTRILQSKYSAITKNNNNFTLNTPNQVPFLNNKGLNVYSVAGNPNSEVITLPGSTPLKYRGDSYRNQAPYFIKSKYQRINACNQNPFLAQVSSHTKSRLNGIGNRQPSGGTGRITTCFFNAIHK